MPAAIAPLASWISLTSSWPMTMSRPVPDSGAGDEHEPETMRADAERVAGGGRVGLESPAVIDDAVRWSSATTSTMPEPQMPTGRAPPMVSIQMPSGSSRTDSIAPVAARIPSRIVGALEGRARCARRRRQALEVLAAEDDLGVGADVDPDDGPGGLVEPGAEDHRHVVGADEAPDARGHVDPAAGRDGHADIAGPDVHRRAGGGDEWCYRQLSRRQTEEQVVHRRISDDARIGDLVADHAGVGRERSDQLVDRLAHDTGELVGAVRPSCTRLRAG